MKTLKTFRAYRPAFHLVLALLLVTARAGLAADTFKFSESLRDKLVCEGHGEDRFCDVGQVGKFSVTLKFAWTDPNSVSNIDGTTAFNLSLGDLTVSFAPSDDPKWVPGKTSATMLFTHINDSDRTVRDGRALVRWNAKGFTASISSRTGFDIGPVLAGGLSGEDPGTVTDQIDFELGFGDFLLDGMLDATGVVKQRTAGAGDNETTLQSITVRGTLVPPVPPG